MPDSLPPDHLSVDALDVREHAVAIAVPLFVLNERLRRQRLYLRAAGRQVMVDDLAMPGISFGISGALAPDELVAAAIEGARARRAFINGNHHERKAA